MQTRRSPFTGILGALILTSCIPKDHGPLAADAVAAWNARILALAETEDGFYTLKGVRTATMMHLAIHDALNAIDPRYHPYPGTALEATPGADPLSAVSAAAYAVTIAQYPDRADLLTAERDRWIPHDADSAARSDGETLGRRAAEEILALRADDDWDADPSYEWHPMGPGVYAEFADHSGTPDGFVFGAGWAIADPFMLPASSAYRVAPPPAINSRAYSEAFNEVKLVGAAASPARTADQTHLALWWKRFAEKSHNQLARDLVVARSVELWDAARLFALLNMSIYDGYVAVFDSKFHYNHWRPYTAIRWASHDGNPDTVEDPDWNNTHGHTYAFPSYPSAHGTVCGAGMTVLARAFGDSLAFTMSSPVVDSAGPGSGPMRMDPPIRSFTRFSDAAWECSLSRVYLGIHFRYDSEAGTALGQRIGRLATDSFLTPRGDPTLRQ